MDKITKIISSVGLFRSLVDKSKLTSNEVLLTLLVCHSYEAKVVLSQKQINEILNITKPQLTRMIQKCIKSGYLVKTRSKEDNRVTLIAPTDKLWSEMKFLQKGIKNTAPTPLLMKIDSLNSKK